MALDRLDHYSIRTTDLDTTRNFYVEVLGLAEGYRPSFDFPGHWLYCGERAVVHLIGIDPDDGQGLVDFLSVREGQEVFLCWVRGEDTIGYWHGTDEGFENRKRIPPGV